MLSSLLLLIGLALLWSLALWFALPINLSTFSNFGLLLLHILPPFGLWGSWLGLRAWQRRRKAQAWARQEAASEGKRQETLLAVRQQREADLAQLRTGCDCRAAIVAGLGEGASALKAGLPEAPLADDEGDAVVDEDAALDPPALSSELQEFAGPLRQALESIYRETPAALVLPVYVAPPTHIPAAETIALIRQLIHEIGASLEPSIAVTPDEVRVAFVPSGNGAADSAITLFDRLPDLPGAVLLALDSPVQRDQAAYDKLTTGDQRAAMTAEVDERQTWYGKPGLAVVALLLTHPETNAMLAAIHDYSRDDDAAFNVMTPFWQKASAPGGQLAPLARLAPAEREAIGQQPVLARIHRAAFGTGKPQARPLEMSLFCQSLMEKALLAGGMSPKDGGAGDDTIVPDTAGEEAAPPPAFLGWLVHNAGTVDRHGPRLGALATAIRHFNFDLHPLNEATNFANAVGDFGAATPWAMLAEAVALVADSGTAVLCADFQMNDGLAMSIAMPGPGN